MRRGVNTKKVLVSLDQETLAILEKYRSWGTPASALIRKAVKAYEFGRNKPHVTTPEEEVTVTYD